MLDLREPAACAEAVAGARRRLQPGSRHGRNGLHRDQQGALHALGADQHASARRPRGTPASSAFLFASSACVYAAEQADRPDVTAAEGGGRLSRRCPRTATAGRSCSASGCAGTFTRTSGSTTRVPRFHNVYGPYGTWDGGREKAPAAICRKVIAAKLAGQHEIEIWGDGEQTRSFIYIDDCDRRDPAPAAERRHRADQPRQLASS